MRNNEERFTKTRINSDPPPAPVTANNSNDALLNFVAPTDFVELPSKGKFYPEGHPLGGKDNLEIRQMTAKDEDILTSNALLKRGIAVERLLQNLIVDKNVNVNSLLSGDRNAILVRARISAYGAKYKTKVQCPVCVQFSDHDFDLSEMIVNYGYDSSIEGVTANKGDNFVFELPTSKVNVEVKLLNGEDEKRLTIMAEKGRKHNLPETGWTDQLKSFIVSINEVTDVNVIERFIDNMPAKDSRHLRQTYAKLVPNVDLKQNVVCGQCYSEVDMEVPLTADFFWPNE
tara:strand:+ start:753 stop:1613 length:861 start_codon:yes stop_codon:yes gene_type:complete